MVGVEQFIKYKTLAQACKKTIDSSFGCSNYDDGFQTIQEAYRSKIVNHETLIYHHPD